MKINRHFFFKAAIFVLLLSLLGESGAAASPPRRIVSLAPNITEIVFGLGLGDRLVGVTTYCDFPRAVLKKPKIGGFSNPSLEAILALRPDAVILTEDGNPPEIAPRLEKLGISIHVFRSSSSTRGSIMSRASFTSATAEMLERLILSISDASMSIWMMDA